MRTVFIWLSSKFTALSFPMLQNIKENIKPPSRSYFLVLSLLLLLLLFALLTFGWTVVLHSDTLNFKGSYLELTLYAHNNWLENLQMSLKNEPFIIFSWYFYTEKKNYLPRVTFSGFTQNTIFHYSRKYLSRERTYSFSQNIEMFYSMCKLTRSLDFFCS